MTMLDEPRTDPLPTPPEFPVRWEDPADERRFWTNDRMHWPDPQPIALSDIKPGDFLGVTSVRKADGKLVAYEVRRFPKPINPGHRPFDGRADQTMTNAAVEATVSAAGGSELTLAYPGGAQKISVPESASISMLVPGTRAQLMPGAPVSLTHDASRVAQRIQVGPRK